MTEGHEELADHRSLMADRWRLVRAFGQPPGSDHTEGGSPAKLSPGTKKIRDDFFEGDPAAQGKFSEAAFKIFQKRFKTMIQMLTNASEGLERVHQEMSP